MLLDAIKTELQLAQDHVKAAQKQLEHLEYQEPTTQLKKVGGPFHKGQVVRNLDTGYLGTVKGFKGKGKVLVKSHDTQRVYVKNYRWLEEV